MFSKATKQVFLDIAHRELGKGAPLKDALDRATKAAAADHQRRTQGGKR